MKNAIQKAAATQMEAPKQSMNALINTMLDQNGLRRRFDELLGARAPQFISSIVSLVNADVNLQKAMAEAPMTVIQSALKAATFDLPIDQNLGYAYILPFNNSIKREDGSYFKRSEATFILGWKGMHQLAMRSGVYKTIQITDVREGELVSYNFLTEELKLNFEMDWDRREELPIIGYAGYFRLINGTEKTIYMSVEQIKAHEKKFRKGQYMTKGWRENFDAMCRKTVYRQLIGKWGVMSIDYRTASPEAVRMAQAIAEGVDRGQPQLEEAPDIIMGQEQPELIEGEDSPEDAPIEGDAEVLQ